MNMYKITLIALTCLLCACQAKPVPEVITQTIVTERKITIVPKPTMDTLYKGMNFETIKETCDSIKTLPNVCIEISIEDYEKLGLNMQIILKHVKEQNAQLDYYRKSVTQDVIDDE